MGVFFPDQRRIRKLRFVNFASCTLQPELYNRKMRLHRLCGTGCKASHQAARRHPILG
jgi:hypothetical protein